MNVPKLRFKEFTDEWNYEIFDNIIDIRSKSYNPNNNINYKCIELENINQGAGTINGYFNSCEQKSTKNIFYKNEVLFGKLRPYLKKYWYATFDGVCSSEIWVAKSKSSEKITNKFILYIFQTNYFLQLCNLSTGSKMPRADWDFIKEHFFAIPTLQEQDKIARFLSLLDKKIELQAKKIEVLKYFKKGLISKLLNEYNYKIMKIKDVLKFEQPTKYIVNSDEYINDSKAIPVLTANKAFILGYCNENNFYDKGDSIIFDDFTMDMKYTNFNYKVKSSAIKILTTKGKNDLRFLYELLLSLNLKSEEHKRHYISVVQEMDVKIPSIEVQKSISSRLELVDNKIIFEEKFLNNLTKLKKGFMQSMFV